MSNSSVFTTSFSFPIKPLDLPSYSFQAYGGIDANETSVIEKRTFGEGTGWNLFDFDDPKKENK